MFTLADDNDHGTVDFLSTIETRSSDFTANGKRMQQHAARDFLNRQHLNRDFLNSMQITVCMTL